MPGPTIKRAGVIKGARWTLNFIEGTNVTLDISDSADGDNEIDITINAAGAAGAPSTVDYLVGTTDAGLSNEIVVGLTPGGELGGTWASPTVDATHSGSAHHAQSHGNADHTSTFIVAADVTFANLNANGSVGSGAAQVAQGNHSHAGAGHTIADAGIAENQRATLDFQDGFEVTDNLGANSTDVDLSYGAAGYPLDVAAAEADGTAITVARSDHVHAHGTGYLADAHHAQSHNHSAAGDGTTLSPATLNIPNAAAPAPTAEGETAWDNDGNFLVVGDGAATKNFYPVVDATSDPLAVSTAAADGTELTTARKDHVHAHEAAHINHDTTWAAKGDLIVASANDTASVVAVGTDGKYLQADSTAGNGVAWAAHVFTIGGFFKSLAAPDAYIIWRAPFACTVTAIRGYVDVGTTTVINAFKGSVATPTNFSTADMTVTSAVTWISDTTLDSTAVASGDAVGIEVVTVGTATEIAIQIDFTRP